VKSVGFTVQDVELSFRGSGTTLQDVGSSLSDFGLTVQHVGSDCQDFGLTVQGLRDWVQGYLAHKKERPPMTLQ